MDANTILAIDIGAQQVRAAVAERGENGELHILGTGTANTDGFANGCVNNMERLRNSIRKAILELEKNWKEDIDPSKMPIYYSISGKDVFYQNIETEMRHISNINPETKIGNVTKEDIDWLKKALEASRISDDSKKIAVIPQCYQVNKNCGIENPIGLNGQEIKAAGLLITDSKSHIADLERAINTALSDDDFEYEKLELIPVAASIASAMAVLSKEEKESGVAILDIGKGCCDLAVFYNEYPILVWSREFAGEFITKEIKNVLAISLDEAEKIKVKFACATPKRAGQKETISISNEEQLPLEQLAQWVYQPLKYLFENAKNALNSNFYGSNFNQIISQMGVVLTGGGANLKEITFVAQEVLELPVKRGKPNAMKISGAAGMDEDMSFATLLGLCIYGTQNYHFKETSAGKKKKKRTAAKPKSGEGLGGSIKNFLKDFGETIKNIKIS